MSKLRRCWACHQLAMGVKFRIAPRHTCDELERQLTRVYKELRDSQKPLDPEIQNIINERFWDMI